jgi:hypothetical protein
VSEQIAEALRLLGAAYRGDWSNFDGRTLRDQLDELSEYLRDPSKPFDLTDWAISGQNICPVSRSWLEYCPEKVEGFPYQCKHAEAHWEAAIIRAHQEKP